ncbi:MAG: hypothetical protein U9Q37_01790 [Euryarchaeota archaeon]|nr:hypothetical protein [Euryarchaeota archaeon]
MTEQLLRRLAPIVVLTVMICLAFVGAASALDPGNPEYWTDMGDDSLHKGETYSVSGYTVKFVDYVPETDLVYISLLRGDELLDELCLNASCVEEEVIHRPELNRSVCDYLNWEDEVIIAIVNETDEYPESETPTQWDDPLIHITFYERSKPAISLEITTGCEVYTPRDSEIRVTVKIENTGDAELKNVDVRIDPGDLRAMGDLTSHFSDLQAEEEGDYLFKWGNDGTIRRYLGEDLGLSWVDKDARISGGDGDTITVEKGDDKITIEISTDGNTVTIDGKDLPDDIPDMEVKGEGNEREIYALSENKEESEKSVYARLHVPQSITDTEGQPYTITANVTGFDDEGVMYAESASTEILVLPRFDLEVRKTVNSHISMDDTVWVRIDLENTGRRDLEVRLNDTIPNGFRLSGNETPGWRFNITPSESLRFSYHIKPERPGVFEVLGAVAEFVMGETNISVRSNVPEIIVDGVCITVNKTAHPEQIREGDTVTITLSVRNTGNMDATIELTDVLPPGAELISGDPMIRTVLAANETNETEYVIVLANPGQVVLGTPWISLSGSGYCYTTPTDVPVIEVTGSIEEPSVMPTSITGDSTLDTRTSPRLVDVSLYETMLVLCMFAGVFLIGRFMRWR